MALRAASVAVIDVTARGLLEYGASLALQEALVRLRATRTVPDTVLLVQVCGLYVFVFVFVCV
jgi:lipoate-protein ligase B